MDLQTRINEIDEFFRYAAEEWPSVRPTVRHEIARRCSCCINSERFVPLIDGVCSVCIEGHEPGARPETEPKRDHAAMTAALGELLKANEGKGKGRYDALVLFSGGKDSGYLVYRLLREHPGLRLLAVTIDNGFFSRVAMANCGHILDRLGKVDHMVFKPKPELYVKTFHHALTHLNEGGCYTTVDRMDGDLAFDCGRNLAASLDIPLMIAGLSPGQVERILELRWFETHREVELSRRAESAGFDLSTLYSPEDQSYWWDGTRWPAARVPRVVYPFYAWGYNEHEVRGKVVELGLMPASKANIIITNNDTIPVMLALDVARMGYSGFEPEFAELVRDGRAERDYWLNFFEALEYLTKHGRFLPRCIDDTLTRLCLTRSDVGIP
jgi:hypothetical protein